LNPEFPVFEPAFVLHVGDRPELGERRPRSGGTLGFEGNCLSASFSPRTWQEVAYIPPEKPIWRLEGEGGRPLRLLDITDFSEDNLLERGHERSGRLDALRDEVIAWALEEGVLREKTWLEIRYPRAKKDAGDPSRWATMTVPDLEAAERVLKLSGMSPHDTGPDGKPIMFTEDRLTGTKLMANRLWVPEFCVDRNSDLPFQMATLLWADEFLQGLDGVWWGECYEFKEWAPRAGIFQRAVPSLEIRIEEGAGWKMTKARELELLAEMVPEYPAAARAARPRPARR